VVFEGKSGRTGSEDRQRATEAGIDLYLIKPVDIEQLEQVLARFHQLFQTSDGLPEFPEQNPRMVKKLGRWLDTVNTGRARMVNLFSRAEDLEKHWSRWAPPLQFSASDEALSPAPILRRR
jgi:hypothetical protein